MASGGSSLRVQGQKKGQDQEMQIVILEKGPTITEWKFFFNKQTDIFEQSN